MAEHTKLPWWFCDYAVFAVRDCIALCDTDIESDAVNRANAAFIVRAVNCHDELVEALELCAGGHLLNSKRKVVEAALAKARGEK